MTEIQNDGGSITQAPVNELIFVPEAENVLLSVRRIANGRQIFAVTDENVARLHPELLPSDAFVLPAGEDGKTLATVENVCRAMLKAGVTRKGIAVGVGGGVVGDITGFAAAVYMRGIRFINVPTTLLAQVDSAIGGKTGVDLDNYKNMIGAFHMPSRIFICPALTGTLPEREWRCGMGELIKTAALDETLYAYVSKHIDKLVKRDAAKTQKAVTLAAAFKKRVTDDDPIEQGRRAVLNFGHTVGHALEMLDCHKLSHGEYILLGMVVELAMAMRSPMHGDDFVREMYALIGKAGMPSLPDFAPEEVAAAARSDKKNTGGKIRVIGVMAAGSPYICDFTQSEFAAAYGQAVQSLMQSGVLHG